ncbi:19732_t:CDS:1, partial [Gigaspora rosea]
KIANEFEGYITGIQIKNKKVETKIAVLVYMDNTAWLAQSREDLEKIIKTAESFYNLMNIKVNSTKSLLVMNTKDKTDTIKCKGEEIKNLDEKE